VGVLCDVWCQQMPKLHVGKCSERFLMPRYSSVIIVCRNEVLPEDLAGRFLAYRDALRHVENDKR